MGIAALHPSYELAAKRLPVGWVEPLRNPSDGDTSPTRRV
jgi:hypothetical protein